MRSSDTTRGLRPRWARLAMTITAIAAAAMTTGGTTGRILNAQGSPNGQRRAWMYKRGGVNAGQLKQGRAGEARRGRGFRHRHDDSGNDVPGLLPHWTRTLTRDGVNYRLTTIGADPRRGPSMTTIPVLLVPLRFEFPDGSFSDATDVVDGKTPIEHILASPIFTPRPFTSNSQSLGRVQWTDAYTRASVWDDLPTRAFDYHVVLSPRVAARQTVSVAYDDWWSVYDDGRDLWVNGPTTAAMTAAMTALIRQMNVPPDTLTVFVAPDTPFVDPENESWAIGFYNDTYDQPLDAAPNTMAVVDFQARGQFDDLWPDVEVMGHELMHWLTNPYMDGEVTPYRNPGPYAEPNWCGDDLYNVVDPVEWMPGVALPDTALPYHLPEALLPRWFTHDAVRRGDTGYSFWGGQTTFGGPCVSDAAIDYEYVDAVPDALQTVPIDINNAGETVGYYFDARSVLHGFFRRADGRTQIVNVPGSIQTLPYAVSEAHEIAGDYVDAANRSHGFYSSNGRLLTLDAPGAIATHLYGIDLRGRLGGHFRDADGRTHGFLYDRGRFTTVDVPGAAHSVVNAINDIGDIALTAYDASAVFMGSWIRHGVSGPMELVTFPGDTNNTGIANLDNRGRVIGEFQINGHTQIDGFVTRQDGSFVRLLVYQANSLNDAGEMVGVRLDGRRYRGFIARIPRRP